MRRKIIAGNWKMNKDHREGAILAKEIADGFAASRSSCEVVLFPPFTTLPAVMEAIRGSAVRAGAQDIYCEDEGAFTGEISGRMIRALGCTHVLVGHSERRHVIGEGGELLARKLRASLRNGLKPVFCVGELLEDREAARAFEVVTAQVRECCEGLEAEEFSRVVLAYEPVWAIGTGKTATTRDASDMHGIIRMLVKELFGTAAAERVPILYGGSVKPESAPDLLGDAEIDGLLVGGASLKSKSFLDIIPR
ncbi:MAG: triose-phosphate isomerase [Candidatus Krumholzibacteria bacterium]|nr:triose-phosphate isomerase [Candidatus Krumholzibacteria bacterium]